MGNSNTLSQFVFSKFLWNIFQAKYYPGVFPKMVTDQEDHMGPVSAVCLSKAPNFKIKGYLVLGYLINLPWVIVKELIMKLQ